MCDTVVVSAESAADGVPIFAKNSDREPDEPQVLEIEPAAAHPEGSRVQCTYLEIEQARRTRAVLLSRPLWMWGAEMGVNEDGLAVGNEAVFTRAPQQDTGLTGMDVVRLVLERCGSAERGVELIGDLLESHGQGGACGYRNKGFRYHNSFLLADPAEAWVVETAGRAWVAERVRGTRSISNGLSIGERHDRAMSGLGAYARDLGLGAGKGRIDFARTFADPALTLAAAARARRGCLEASLGADATLASTLAALRDHGRWQRMPGWGLRLTVCAHGSWLPTRAAGQTTSSLVARLGEHGPLVLATATSAPCTSVFKPIWIDSGLGGYDAVTSDTYDPGATWWRHERLHRRAMSDLGGFLRGFAGERDALEAALLERARQVGELEARARLTQHAFDHAAALEERWLGRWTQGRGDRGLGPRGLYWRRLSRRDQTPA